MIFNTLVFFYFFYSLFNQNNNRVINNELNIPLSQWQRCLGLTAITFLVNFELKIIRLEALCRFDWGKVFCCPSKNPKELLEEEEKDPKPQNTQKEKQI
jgi:hypothetical protein